MFPSTRLRATAALSFIAASMLLAAHSSNAQTFGQDSSQAPQSAPPSAPPPSQQPILSVNDPHNPMHYTADQQRKFYQVKSTYQQEVTTLLQNKTLNAQQKQAKIIEYQKAAFAEFNKCLTPTQSAKVKAEAAAVHAKREKLVALRTANVGKYRAIGTKLASSLSPQQKKQINELKTNAIAQANAINSGTASDQDKQQQLMQLQQTFQGQMSAILTPAQRGLLSQMQALTAAEPAEEAQIMKF